MLMILVILFLLVVAGVGFNTWVYLEKQQTANLAVAVCGVLVSLMMIAQYMVAGLR